MTGPGRVPRPGEVVLLGRAASVQFAADRAITLRVVAVDRKTYWGWVWLSGYVLNSRGQATAKRAVFVQIAGIRAPAPPSGRRRS